MLSGEKNCLLRNCTGIAGALATGLIFFDLGKWVLLAVILLAVIPAIFILTPKRPKKARTILYSVASTVAVAGFLLPKVSGVSLALMIFICLFSLVNLANLRRKKLKNQLLDLVVLLPAGVIFLLLITRMGKNNFHSDIYVFAIAFAALAMSLLVANISPESRS